MNEKVKVFLRYTMYINEEKNEIINVLGKDGETTKFAFSFYKTNEQYLDQYVNIGEWVKPKREHIKNNNIVINLDDLTVNYSGNLGELEEDDVKLAITLLKNYISENNEELKTLKEQKTKLLNDLKILKSLNDFKEEEAKIEQEIKEIDLKVEELLK